MKKYLSMAILCFTLSPLAWSADRPLSPRGQSAILLPGADAATPWKDGKWLDVDYGRPLLRGRDHIFGSGADYGTKVTAGAPVWRAGANQTSRLNTEVALTVGGKKIAPGSYNIFIDLKEGNWTLIMSTQAAATSYTPKDKKKIWGSYGYDAKLDLLRAPMKLTESNASIEQFTIDFVDVTSNGGTMRFAWDKTIATVPFTIAK
jgi:hypothetical protein